MLDPGSATASLQAPQAASGSNAALVTFGIYTLVVFALAWFSHKMLMKRKFLNEYYLGSRGLGVLALTLTFAATSASAGSFVGFPAFVYAHGWIVALWIASYMVVPICGMGLMGKRLNQVARRADAITLPDMLRGRFESRALALLATCLIMFLLAFYLIPQFKTAGIIMDKLFQDVPVYGQAKSGLASFLQDVPLLSGIEPGYLLCLSIFAVMVIAYTTFGGFRAVVWTDILQGFVMVFGVIFMLVMALVHVGGLSNATDKLAKMTPPRLGTTVFESAERAKRTITVPSLTWFTIPDEAGGTRLFRTNTDALIKAGQTRSNEVKVVEITSPGEIADITARPGFVGGKPAPLPGLIAPGEVEVKKYARGAGQTGVYVSGPGPSFTAEDGFLPFGLAISFFFFWAISGTGQPGNMVRLMAFDSSKTLRRSICCITVYYGIIYFPLVVIFCCARVISPGLEQNPDRIMPEMAFTLAQAADVPWLAGLLVAAPFAAAMSTVDSFMLMISSSVVRDIYQRNINPAASERTIKRMGFGVTLIVGIVVSIGAVNPPKFLQYLIVFTGGGLAVSFLFPVALALYWPRFNAAGAIAAMLGGLASYLSLYLAGFIVHGTASPVRLHGLHPLLWGFASSLLWGVVVALITRPPPPHLVRKFFYAEK